MLHQLIGTLLLTSVSLAASAGDILIAEDARVFPFAGLTPAGFHRLNTDTDVLTRIAMFPDMAFLDVAQGSDGLVYVGGPDYVTRHRLDGTSLEPIWASVDRGLDIAWDSAGHLVVMDARLPVSSGLYEIDAAGTAHLLDPVSGYYPFAMNIPRAGPVENGVLLVGASVTDRRFYLHRYQRQVDGSLQREGPFGPLPLTPLNTCRLENDRSAAHLEVFRDGQTFLVADRCTNNLEEFDLDGNHVRTFAHVEPDPSVSDPFSSDPTRVFPDFISNFVVTRDDHVYVAMFRRVYHFDPQGVLVRKIDHLFNWASALCELDPPPFASQVHCEPRGLGFWKRQCLGEEPSRRSRSSAVNRPDTAGPPVHPFFGNGRLPTVQARVDARLAQFGVTACEALWPQEQRLLRARALMHFAAALFNVEDGQLHEDCMREVDGEQRSVRSIIASIESLLGVGDDDSLHEAQRLSEVLNTPVVP